MRRVRPPGGAGVPRRSSSLNCFQRGSLPKKGLGMPKRKRCNSVGDLRRVGQAKSLNYQVCLFLEQNQVGTSRLGLELQPRFVNGPGALGSAFDAAASVEGAAELALSHRLPAASLTGPLRAPAG
jgi:hypothetical protein